MRARPFTEQDLHLALDGEMLADDRANFEAWLDGNPEMKAKSARFFDDIARLRAAFAGILNEPIPDRLTRLVTGGATRPTPWALRWRAAAAAVAIFIAGVGGGHFVAPDSSQIEARGDDDVAESAIAAHVTYAADQAHAVEVGASDKPYLENWLSRRIGLKLVAPDLRAEGFELLGGRVLPAGQGTAALLVYRDQTGAQVSVYVKAEGEAMKTGTYTSVAGGPTAIYWLDRGYSCVIVGSLPPDQMDRVARSAWQQLVKGMSS